MEKSFIEVLNSALSEARAFEIHEVSDEEVHELMKKLSIPGNMKLLSPEQSSALRRSAFVGFTRDMYDSILRTIG